MGIREQLSAEIEAAFVGTCQSEEWLDVCITTALDSPAFTRLLDLAELAESKPEYRLAVVNSEHERAENVWTESETIATFYRVVKMAGEAIDKPITPVP